MQQDKSVSEKSERRRSFRMPLSAVAVIHRGVGNEGPFRVQDISIGGCRVERGPFSVVGERVSVSIRVHDGTHLWVPAEVVRVLTDEIALRFRKVSAPVEDRIHDLAMRSLEQTNLYSAPVLLVHDKPVHVLDLIRLWQARGQRVFIAKNGREVERVLKDSGEPIRLAFVAPRVGHSRAFEILKLIQVVSPRVRCVLIDHSPVTDLTVALEKSLSLPPARVDGPGIARPGAGRGSRKGLVA